MRAPSWICRMVPAPVILPKLAELRVLVGLFRFTRPKTLVTWAQAFQEPEIAEQRCVDLAIARAAGLAMRSLAAFVTPQRTAGWGSPQGSGAMSPPVLALGSSRGARWPRFCDQTHRSGAQELRGRWPDGRAFDPGRSCLASEERIG